MPNRGFTPAAWVVVIAAILIMTSPAGAQAGPCPDADGDGYADCATSTCDPTGAVCGDCDDGDPDRHPGATDTCNGTDDDCNGTIDDGVERIVSTRTVVDPDGRNDDYFGSSIASIADLDGDGIADVLVGAPGRRGHVVLLSGADGQLIRAMVPRDSNDVGAGASVADIGDLDGDGFHEVATGSTRNFNSHRNEWGSVFVFSGRDGQQQIECAIPDGRIGGVVLGIEDQNFDRVPDFLVSATRSTTHSLSLSVAAVLFSGNIRPGGECEPLRWFFEPYPTVGDGAAMAFAIVGDVDGDNHDDFAISTYGDGRGDVVVFAGNTHAELVRLTAPEADGARAFGAALAGGRDFDGDGVPDLIVGDPFIKIETWGRHGRILLYSGADWSPILEIPNPKNLPVMGDELATMPDLDGDGVPEIVTRAWDDSPSYSEVLVFSGADGTLLRTLPDPGLPDDGFGRVLQRMPDTDGDGRDEIAIGSPNGALPWGDDVGFVTMVTFESDCDGDGVGVFGGDCDDHDVEIAPSLVEICDDKDNNCNDQVDEDVDGDGAGVCEDCDDANPAIYPGAPESCNERDDDCDGSVDEGLDADDDGFAGPCDCGGDDPSVHPGATEFCDGLDQDCDGSTDEGFDRVVSFARVYPEGAPTRYRPDFDRFVVNVGDLTSDGIDDYAESNAVENRVELRSGADRGLICRPAPTSLFGADGFGTSVAGVGDVSGDGVPDVAIGSPRGRGEPPLLVESGSVDVYSGADCSLLTRLLDPDGVVGDDLGTAVAAIGDRTGDEVPEIAASATGWNDPGLTYGQVLVFDPVDGSVVARLRDPHGSSEVLGLVILAVGDLTRDGIDDVLVRTRRPYRYPSLLVYSGEDWSFERRIGFGDWYVHDEVVLDDVSGDGVPDIAMVNANDSTAAPNAGAVRIVSGSDGSVLDTFVDPESVYTDRMSYLDVAPDMDGDGARDILVGAPRTSPGTQTSGAGKVVVFSARTGNILFRYSPSTTEPSPNFGFWATALHDRNRTAGLVVVARAPGDDDGGAPYAGSTYWLAPESDCDADGFGVLGNDCDDDDPTANPGVFDPCDGMLQDDCLPGDGTGESWYRMPCDGLDSDLCVEGLYTCVDGAQACDDHTTHSAEVCSDVDDDCDGEVDNVRCSDYDVDDDGRLDAEELVLIGRAFGSCGEAPAIEGWDAVDYDEDGCIDGVDLAILANLWGRSCDGDAVVCE